MNTYDAATATSRNTDIAETATTYMRHAIIAIIAIIAAAQMSACATIVSGTTDDVAIDTKPPGAACSVVRDGREIGNIMRTPGTVTVSRTGEPLYINCATADAAGRETDDAGFNAWTLGNLPFMLLGAVGLIVDGISGAYHGYDDVTVDMTRVGP